MNTPQNLETIIRQSIKESLWKPEDVTIEPSVTLTRWQVFKVKSDGVESIHFIGWNFHHMEGRVSSSIVEYDPTTKTGISKSNRKYILFNSPGIDRDADYVWNTWIAGMKLRHTNVEIEEITDQYVSV